LISEFASLLLV